MTDDADRPALHAKSGKAACHGFVSSRLRAGTVIEKAAVEGDYVDTGQKIYRDCRPHHPFG